MIRTVLKEGSFICLLNFYEKTTSRRITPIPNRSVIPMSEPILTLTRQLLSSKIFVEEPRETKTVNRVPVSKTSTN